MARTTTESKPKTKDTRTKTASTDPATGHKVLDPGAAFKDAISKGLKNPEDYMYMYSKGGKNYFKNKITRDYKAYTKGGTIKRKRGGTVSRKKGSKIMIGYKAGGKV
jgi:hypothetical protein